MYLPYDVAMTITTTRGTRRAAVYVRQSQERRDKSEGSPRAQREAASDLITREGWTSAGYYEDKDLSAFTGVDRPEFNRLLNDARAGRFDVIVVYYISRFSRLEPKDALPGILELQRAGVQLVSVNEGPITDDLVGLISLLMRLQSAYEESANKSKHVKATKKLLKEAGGFTGGTPPYGFGLEIYQENGLTLRRLVHAPDEVDVIREVFALMLKHDGAPYANGKHHPGSISGVAASLNERGVPTRRNVAGTKVNGREAAWKPTTLRRIVSDPRIMGHAVEPVYTTRKKKDGTEYTRVTGYRSKRDADGKPVIAYEPIVSAADYHAVQRALDGRVNGAALTRGESLLSGLALLYCECGWTMNRAVGRTPTSHAYRCARPKGTPEKVHTGGCGISTAKLEDYVARRVIARLTTSDPTNPEDAEWLEEAQRRFAATVSAPETAAEQRTLRAEIADLESELGMLYDDRKAGIYSGEFGRKRFGQEVARLEESAKTVRERLAALDAITSPVLDPSMWAPEDGSDPIGEESWWGRADQADRRAMLRLFLDRIEVRKAVQVGGRYEPDSLLNRVTLTWAERPQEAA